MTDRVLYVKLDEALHDRLKALATANDRTMAAEVRRALVAHLGTSPSVAAKVTRADGSTRTNEVRRWVEPRFKP